MSRKYHKSVRLSKLEQKELEENLSILGMTASDYFRQLHKGFNDMFIIAKKQNGVWDKPVLIKLVRKGIVDRHFIGLKEKNKND